MKRALFTSNNLLGDGLYIGPAAEVWYQQYGHMFDEVWLQTLPGYVSPIYKHMGVPWKIVFERPPGEFEFEHVFDVGQGFFLSDQKKCHLVQSYAELLGVVRPQGWIKKPNYNPPVMDVDESEKGLVLISMFSMSCSSRENPPRPPNKMLPWEKWKPLLATMRERYPDSPIKLLGAKEDRLPPEASELLGITDENYMTGVAIDKLANIMRYAKMIINVDNGMGHLAAAVGLNEFLLVPKCLQLHYIVPWGHPGLRLAHIDPVTVRPTFIIFRLNSAISDWFERESIAKAG